jgi:cobalt-precorrin-5B (C1)-methyltransferase
LRSGWTTGTCACAAAVAAYQALLTGEFPDPVEVALPGGKRARLALHRTVLTADSATASVIKDAGDDPDVIHGAEIMVSVAQGAAGSGVSFRAGAGVGIVTLPGLSLAVGEPAINPVPRAMMEGALQVVALGQKTRADVIVTVSIPGGEALAAKTLNERLGIKGGLSILGTTGVVVPYSCAAWIHSIHRGIDVARALMLPHLAAATGSTSEAAVRRLYDLPEAALIDMGDFAGGVLKYLRTHPVPRLTIAGGFGKLCKLAQGHLYLHSAKSQLDVGALAGELAALGASAETVQAAHAATTAAQILGYAREAGLALGDRIAGLAQAVARPLLADETAVEVLIFDRTGALIGRGGG